MPAYLAKATSAEEEATTEVTVPWVLAELLEDDPWVTAHRGSGGEFPEHTMAAWQASVDAGAKAIEVSLHSSSDDELFGWHDTTWDRMTNGEHTGPVGDETWAEIQQIQVVPQPLLGDGWPNQPIPHLQEIIDAFADEVVIFLEAKSNPAVPLLQQYLLTLPQRVRQNIVIKGFFESTMFPWARDNGFPTWGYINADTPAADMDAVDELIDMWGVPVSAPDSKITEVVERPGGKPVMCWEVHRHVEVERLVGLGVRGLMCSQLLYVTADAPHETSDSFSTHRKAPGNFGPANYSPNSALNYEDHDGTTAAYLPSTGGQACLMGSMCPVPEGAGGFRIAFEMMFPVLPAANLHAGVAFGKALDNPYWFSSVQNTSGGYHWLLRPNEGLMQVYSHQAGVAPGTQLGSVDVPPLGAGEWVRVELDVTPESLIARHLDSDPAVELTVADTEYRGRYFHVHNGSLTSANTIARFRNLSVAPLN